VCGVAGFWTPDHPVHNGVATLTAMTDAIRHRGPDSDGRWYDEAAGMFLGHRRLSIIDVSPGGAQPMVSASGRYVISFNGEIYNFQELRTEHERRGVQFRGHSDTEVLLGAIERWGVVAALQKCAGMFAIALWDRHDRTLVLGRDRIGEKPLYYGWSGRSFLFGSELKALRKHPEWRGQLDRNAIAVYLRHSYIPAPHSIYVDVRKVVPGTLVVVSPDRRIREQRYWSMAEAAERGAASPLVMREAEAADELERILRQTVRQQMVSDVPLGAFLSGGVDSSLVVGLMQAESVRPVKTFTIKFDDVGYDESAHARAVAEHLKTDHTELTVKASDALAVIPSLPDMYDEPFADSSQIPTYLVSKLARQQVTVSLSGDGGDEFFGGYPRYAHVLQLWNKLRWSPYTVRLLFGRALSAVPVGGWEVLFRNAPASIRARAFARGDRMHKLAAVLTYQTLEATYRRFVTDWPDPEGLALGATEASTVLTREQDWPALLEPLHRLMYQDSVSYLPDDIFTKVDRASMAVSLETRAPLVDHRVVEFAWRIPAAFNFENGRGKRMLRHVLDRFVPAAIIDRPKMGFGVPIDRWLRGPLREWAETLLSEERLRRDGFFDAGAVRQKWNEHLQGTVAGITSYGTS
jgi:asparagine synthase (glutamine-hydrolysing)